VVERGVEDAALIFGGSIDRDLTELRVPLAAQRLLNSAKVPLWNLGLEVLSRLLQADERGADARFDNLSLRGMKSGEGSGGEVGLWLLGVRPGVGEGPAELNDEVALEVWKP
jgi:hypothetical protein